jgi:hypothetical protein
MKQYLQISLIAFLTLFPMLSKSANDDIEVCFESHIWLYNTETKTYKPLIEDGHWKTCKIV